MSWFRISGCGETSAYASLGSSPGDTLLSLTKVQSPCCRSSHGSIIFVFIHYTSQQWYHIPALRVASVWASGSSCGPCASEVRVCGPRMLMFVCFPGHMVCALLLAPWHVIWSVCPWQAWANWLSLCHPGCKQSQHPQGIALSPHTDLFVKHYNQVEHFQFYHKCLPCGKILPYIFWQLILSLKN